jgi:hypothetical protein
MNLTEAKEEVVGLTKRPEKEVEILSQLNRAISFYTLKVNWARDLVEDTLTLDPTLYGQTIDISGLARFRKVKYLRPTSQRIYLKTIGVDKVITPNGRVQPNRFFVGGQSLTITLGQLDSSLEIGYYTFAPTLNEVAPDNEYWMLDVMPWAIIDRAASHIFKGIGDETSAKQYLESSMEFFVAARKDFADATDDETS